jgi:chaperonin GroEL (HSP60 family)
LIKNASMDLTSSLSELTNFHHKGLHTYGIDVLRSIVADMKHLSVVEPLLNKKAQFTMATEAAISILKINEIIVPVRCAYWLSKTQFSANNSVYSNYFFL